MISQRHIIIQIIYGAAWSLAVSLTTFGAFVSASLWMGERQSDDDTFDESSDVKLKNYLQNKHVYYGL